MKAILVLIAVLYASTSFAFKGSIEFTDQEKAEHAAKSKLISETAANCLSDHYADHVAFFKLHHVSKYFGNRRYIKGERPGRRADGQVLTPIRPELRKHGIDPKIENLLTSMSCIDLARTCLKVGFAAAGQDEYWERIDEFNLLNDNIGDAIQAGLQALGWKLVYWNPDPSQNAAWDAADRERTPSNPSHVWGNHAEHYRSVMKKNMYYKYPVDDKTTLVGFGTKVPKAFKKIPFFVGTAHVGYHVFVGALGNVIEAHSVRSLFSMDNMENNMFNPLARGAPMATNTEVYLSGLIAVPPGNL